MFYHQLPRADLNQKESIQKILEKIKVSAIGNLKYFRWDDQKEKFLQYPPRKIIKLKRQS